MALFKKSTYRIFLEYLDQKKIKYTPNDEKKRVNIRYRGDNFSGQDFTFIFDDDGESAALRVFSICQVPDSNLPRAPLVCNKLNNEYRWFRFYLDSDQEVTMAADVSFDERTVGPICYEILQHGVSILDKTATRISALT